MKVVLNSCYGGFHVLPSAAKYCDLDHESGDLHLSQKLAEYIEKFGSEKASGDFSKLIVKDIPTGTKFMISEYDGYESIVTEDDINWIVATDTGFIIENKTLRNLLNEDGYDRGSNEPITVYTGESVCLNVSHRYLDSPIWHDELNSKAERIKKGIYRIIKE